MKVLIISANFLPMSPSGPAYIAGAALEAGHEVEIFDAYLAGDLDTEIKSQLVKLDPDVVGISITVVTNDIRDSDSEFCTKYVDFRPAIKKIVQIIKQNSNARIVLGGPGFNYYSKEWLNYLELDYGIRGEAEFSFPLFLENIDQGKDISGVPGCVVKKNGKFFKVARDRIKNLDGTALPAYHLFNAEEYKKQNLPAALLTKRGCAFNCIFCPYRSLEGAPYRLKSPKRVADEIENVMTTTACIDISFCDNSFNCSKKHAEDICKEIVNRKLKINWSSGAIKPLGITKRFCRLMKESGCSYIGLSIETASKKILANMNRGYSVDDIRESLDNLSESGIPFGLSILIGGPGETPQTISETFSLVDNYKMITRIWVSIGIYLWTHHQKILDVAREQGQLNDDNELFNGAYYISPELSEDFMMSFIESLKSRSNCLFQVNKPYSKYVKKVNDCGR
jgi:radical SAM superfamily enzyme YgiQ (UPF0313 family)